MQRRAEVAFNDIRHTHIHTHIHAHIHTHIHTYIHTHIHTLGGGRGADRS